MSANGGGSKKSGSDAGSSSAASAGESASSGGGDSSDKPKALPAVGTPVRDGKFEFTVTKVERGLSTAGTNEFMQQHAQGSYTFVHVTVKNIGTESQTLDDSSQKAMDASGTQYSVDSSAGMALDNNKVWLNAINPGNQVKGVFVYDVPAGTQLKKIEFHDSFLSGGVEAAL